jgi:hypothetical protein
MNDDCRRFLEEPEANRAHADSCRVCRLLLDELGRSDAIDGVSLAGNVDELPVAPWEGARYRPWGGIAAVTLVLLAAAVAAFVLSDFSPVTDLRGLSLRVDVVDVGFSFSELIRNAPAGFHVFVVIGFVAVNALLYFLLRRPTRGYDATK